MNTITRNDLLQEVIKQEQIFSIHLDFEDLIKKGIIERKRGNKRAFAILIPDKFPMEAINQSRTFTQVTTNIKDKEVTKMYIEFPTEKQRLKTLNEYQKIREQLSK